MGKESNNTIQAFWVAIGSFSTMVLGILSAAILSRYFNKSDYGTYKQILYVYSSLLIIFTAGLPRVFSYFLPRYPVEEGKSIVNKVNNVLFVGGLSFALFLFSFSDIIGSLLKNNELGYALKVFSPIPIFLLPTLGIEGIFATYRKTYIIAIYNTCSRILMLMCIILPVVLFKGTYIHALYGWLVSSVISFFYAYYLKSLPFRGENSIKTSLQYKSIFSYSIPLVIASGWGIAIKSADQFYVSRFFGSEVFAEFSNGFIELPFVSMVTTSASVVLMPYFSKLIHQNTDKEGLVNTWVSALSKSAKICYPLIVFFIFFASKIMVLLYSNLYIHSGIYFQINMVLNFFNIIIFAPLFLALGKGKEYSTVHMVLAFTIWISHFVVVKFVGSPVAIAINSTFLNIVKILYFLYSASRHLEINFLKLFPIKTLLKYLFHALLCVSFVSLIIHYFHLEMYIANLLLLIGSALFYGILIVISGKIINIDYIGVVRPLINKIKKR